ncbi:hypothetical protein AMATHDRAFT_2323 [Amanita thiersii Skay4041]|uniref:Uncharacterized protein n=1 Tax=Amanita thiersii Skay4041 TaxID=703135 RepID=A0A2A9NVI9_9AGAR|nr:hypothetical protein AMATHDRAFT_2323 [Amanita thiersii Skay4041]
MFCETGSNCQTKQVDTRYSRHESTTPRTRANSSQETGNATSSRSLMISSDLNALLEFEDHQHGGRTMKMMPSHGSVPFPASVSSEPPTPISLPPPPRGRRALKSTTGTTQGKGGSVVGRLVSSSKSNPYINRAPTLEELLLVSRGVSPPHTVLKFQFLVALPTRPPRQQQLKFSRQPCSIFPTLLQFTGRGVSATRRRPFISHVSPTAESSSDQSDSGTTHEAASTTEDDHHISISSTIYPASSSDTHYTTMFNFLNLSSPTDQGNMDTDHHSFIDFLSSPAKPDTTSDYAFLPNNISSNNDGDDSHVYESSYSLVTVRSKSLERSKSPTPTISKLAFNKPLHKPGRNQDSPRGSPAPQSRRQYTNIDPLPPTTNLLDVYERANLIRRSQKLTRVFGETPEAEALLSYDHQHRTAAGREVRGIPRSSEKDMNSHEEDVGSGNGKSGRRYSLPLNVRSCDKTGGDASSEVSFIDLSDEEAQSGMHPASAITATPSISRPNPDISYLSLFESLSPEEQAEEDRRRKRDKLAKLHRFLGYRVPPSLVLGIDDPDTSLPPILPPGAMHSQSNTDDVSRRAWLRRRRSSSVAAIPSSWSDDVDRLKEELNDKEKAINVKRAQKMEKVFGVAPPQTLYHTRHSPSPSVFPLIDSGYKSQKSSPTNVASQKNPNRSAYIKSKPKKLDRPETSESSKRLLSQDTSESPISPTMMWSALTTNTTTTATARRSLVYTHYQHSLNSLSDILDRDDRESLAELHEYLNNSEYGSPPLSRPTDRRLSNASSIKSERRRSLPARTSMISVSSDFSITSPEPEMSDFQLRRRRAAKLTHFFGVDYRELINDILESIERGLEHEQKRGTLLADEMEDLLQRLRELKIKRKGIY